MTIILFAEGTFLRRFFGGGVSTFPTTTTVVVGNDEGSGLFIGEFLGDLRNDDEANNDGIDGKICGSGDAGFSKLKQLWRY